MENNIKEMVKLAYAALEDKKAINPKIIDISKVSVMADYRFGYICRIWI